MTVAFHVSMEFFTYTPVKMAGILSNQMLISTSTTIATGLNIGPGYITRLQHSVCEISKNQKH